ncbi:hypothetical protein CHUAL_009336 [Chamberlinius hualienensis]
MASPWLKLDADEFMDSDLEFNVDININLCPDDDDDDVIIFDHSSTASFSLKDCKRETEVLAEPFTKIDTHILAEPYTESEKDVLAQLSAGIDAEALAEQSTEDVTQVLAELSARFDTGVLEESPTESVTGVLAELSARSDAGVLSEPSTIYHDNYINERCHAEVDKRRVVVKLERINLDNYRIDSTNKHAACTDRKNLHSNSSKEILNISKKPGVKTDKLVKSESVAFASNKSVPKSRRKASGSKNKKSCELLSLTLPKTVSEKVHDLQNNKKPNLAPLTQTVESSSRNCLDERKTESSSSTIKGSSRKNQLVNGGAASKSKLKIVLNENESNTSSEVTVNGIKGNNSLKKRKNLDTNRKTSKSSESSATLIKNSKFPKVEPPLTLGTKKKKKLLAVDDLTNKPVEEDHVRDATKIEPIIIDLSKIPRVKRVEKVMKVNKRLKKCSCDFTVKSKEEYALDNQEIVNVIVEKLILDVVASLENENCGAEGNEMVNCAQKEFIDIDDEVVEKTTLSVDRREDSSMKTVSSENEAEELNSSKRDKLLETKDLLEKNGLKSDLLNVNNISENATACDLTSAKNSAVSASFDAETSSSEVSSDTNLLTSIKSSQLSECAISESLESVVNVKDNVCIDTKQPFECISTGEVKWLNPVANLTKSENQLKKIKRCSGMSREFRQKVKTLKKRFPKLYLIEIVRLDRLKMPEILKLQKNASYHSLGLQKSNSVSEAVKPKPTYSRPKSTFLSSFDAAMMEQEKYREKELKEKRERYRKYKNNISLMEKQSNDLADRISVLPKIPKKARANLTSEKKLGSSTSETAKAVLKQVKNKLDEWKTRTSAKPVKEINNTQNLKSSTAVKPKLVEDKLTSRGKQFNVEQWYKLELSNFWDLIREPKPSPVGLSETAANKIDNFVIKFDERNSNVAESQSCGFSVSRNISNENLPEHKPLRDGLSTHAHFSDDELSILAPSSDSLILVEDDAELAKYATGKSSDKTLQSIGSFIELRSTQNALGYTRLEIWDSGSDEEGDESAWEKEKICMDSDSESNDETPERSYFDTKLSKMTHSELLKQYSILTIGENLAKCLAVFTYLMKHNEAKADVMNYLQKLIFVANRNKMCIPHIISKFIRTVLVHASRREKLQERMNILICLMRWLLQIEIENDGNITKTNCRISLYYLSKILEKDFSFFLELYNKTIIEAINEDLTDLLYLYRYGSDLHFSLDVEVVRALITSFGRHNMWLWCQNLYNLGCTLAIYNRLKVRQWPIVIVLKSFFSSEEISIILYDLLSKFQHLIASKFFSDRGLNADERFTIFIRLECFSSEERNHQVNMLKLIEKSSEALYNRLIEVLKSMLGTSVVTDMDCDTKRSFVKLEKPLVEKLLKHLQDWTQKCNIGPFPDYNRPGYHNTLAYGMLTVNGVYCHYDDNPFK